jgi:NADP-dependent 3-hydroxy acid dehydrogenase YdfG
MTFINQKILITGASSGLGLELARQLTSLGAIVTGTCFNSQNITEIQESINLQNGNQNFQLVQSDVSNYDQTCKIVEQMGNVNILINNAGVYIAGKLEDNDTSKIINTINTNLLGTILTTKAVLPSMLKSNKGLIFCVSSNCAIYNKKERAIYGASKWGIRGFVDNLKLDLEGTRVKAFGFYPAGIATDLFVNAGVDHNLNNMMKPEDLASLIIDTLANSDKYILDHIVVDKPNF